MNPTLMGSLKSKQITIGGLAAPFVLYFIVPIISQKLDIPPEEIYSVIMGLLMIFFRAITKYSLEDKGSGIAGAQALINKVETAVNSNPVFVNLFHEYLTKGQKALPEVPMQRPHTGGALDVSSFEHVRDVGEKPTEVLIGNDIYKRVVPET